MYFKVAHIRIWALRKMWAYIIKGQSYTFYLQCTNWLLAYLSTVFTHNLQNNILCKGFLFALVCRRFIAKWALIIHSHNVRFVFSQLIFFAWLWECESLHVVVHSSNTVLIHILELCRKCLICWHSCEWAHSLVRTKKNQARF